MHVLGALVGGGMRGIAQVGMLQEITARGIRVDAWTGVSTGALQAGFMSQAPPDVVAQQAHAAALARFWLGLEEAPVSGGLLEAIGRVVLGKPSLHRADALRAVVGRGITAAPAAPVEIGISSLRTGAYLGLRPNTMADLQTALVASSSVPGIFPPVGAWLDGGVIHVAPLKPAFALANALWPVEEPVVILLFHCLPLDAQKLPPPTAEIARNWGTAPLWAIAPRAVDMVETALERADLDGARLINDVFAALALMKQQGVLVPLPERLAGKRWVRIVQLAPEVGPGYDMLTYDHAKLVAYLQAGRDAAARQLDALGWPPPLSPILESRLASTGAFPTGLHE